MNNDPLPPVLTADAPALPAMPPAPPTPPLARAAKRSTPAGQSPSPPSVRLRAIASRLRSHPRASVADLYRMGKLLAETKALLGHGRFAAWAAEEAGIGRAIVSHALLAHQRIKAPIELLEGVKASAARVLTSRKVSRSPKLTQRALAAEPDRPGGMVGLRAVQSAVSTVDPSAVHRMELAKEGATEALGRRLATLVADPAVSSFHVSVDRDAELPMVAVTLFKSEGERETPTRVHVSRETVGEVFACLTGEEETRFCKPCKRNLPAVSFSKGSHNCKACERERVGTYTRKKRKANREVRERIRGMDRSATATVDFTGESELSVR